MAIFSFAERRLERDIARLADGSLDAAQLEAAQRRIAAAGPEWARALERQRATVGRIQAASPAVADGRSMLEAAAAAATARATAASTTPVVRRRLTLAGGAATALGVAGLAIALLAGNGTSVGPSVADAATLALRPPQAPAPAPAPGNQALLAVAQSGVPFPDWTTSFRWRADGVRRDRLGGRDVTTVFYASRGHRIAYSILAGSVLAIPRGAGRERYQGTALWVSTLGGRTVVTWNRLGHTCVLSASDIPREVLAHLAGWHGQGRVAF